MKRRTKKLKNQSKLLISLLMLLQSANSMAIAHEGHRYHEGPLSIELRVHHINSHLDAAYQILQGQRNRYLENKAQANSYLNETDSNLNQIDKLLNTVSDPVRQSLLQARIAWQKVRDSALKERDYAEDQIVRIDSELSRIEMQRDSF
ncbi:MAG: hypothetical protein K2X81_16310 [Candidatus Obscuribacterales bacterium]|nr:hypothetical protein [Candidatus Obscuribacterales bacterium]